MFFKKKETVGLNVEIDEKKFERLLDDALNQCLSIGGKTFEKLSNAENHDPHIVAEAMCWKCGHRWIATFPENTLLKQLQCPHCEEKGYAFLTNQDLDAVKSEE